MGNPNPKTAHLAKYKWKPGESGGGHRPKGSLGIKEQLKQILAKMDKEGRWAVPVAERLIAIGLGDPKVVKEKLGLNLNTDQVLKALKEIQDRTEGRPKETVEQTSVEKTELVFTGFDENTEIAKGNPEEINKSNKKKLVKGEEEQK